MIVGHFVPKASYHPVIVGHSAGAADMVMKYSVGAAIVNHSVGAVKMYHSAVAAISDHSDGSVITDQSVGAEVMSHSVEVGAVIMVHSAVAMDVSVGTVTMNHSVVAVTTDHSVVDNAAAFAVNYFAVATSEYSEALSLAAVPMKDHSDSVVDLAIVGYSSVAVVIGRSQ